MTQLDWRPFTWKLEKVAARGAPYFSIVFHRLGNIFAWCLRHGVFQGTRRRYRRLFAEGEGGAIGGSAGCFPDFYTPQDFEDWLQGNFQSE